jgi:hypothetical protein
LFAVHDKREWNLGDERLLRRADAANNPTNAAPTPWIS